MKCTFHGWNVGVLAASCFVLSATAAVDPIAPQLRSAVEKGRSQLGDLQPWQEEAFQNEVLPSAARFVKDYGSRGGVLTRVEIDFDAIKRYLSFNASQVFPTEKSAILAVRATETCTPCVGAVPFVRKDLEERLKRRGFSVVTLSAVESAVPDLSEIMAKKSAVGFVLASIKNVEDAEHDGDRKNELSIEFRFPGTLLSRVQKEMEVLPNDSIELAMSRLAGEGITDLGNLVRQAHVNLLEAEGNEGIEVVFTGLTNFSQVQDLKKGLQAHFPANARVIERRFQRGSVAIAVIGEVSAAEVTKALQTVAFPQVKLRVMGTREDGIDVVATPQGTAS